MMAAPLPDDFATWLRDTFAPSGRGIQVAALREPVVLTREQAVWLVSHLSMILVPPSELGRAVKDYLDKQP